jgi:hypothetical protein
MLMSNIARALAASDPHGAERIAQSIPHPDAKARALSAVAQVLAARSR